MDAAPLPRNYATEALAASIRLRGSIVVYGFTVYNTKASAQYLCMFDADALPADTSIPIFSWPLPANNGVGFGYAPNGRRFDAGLVLCNSSTDATKTIGSADCLFDVQYDVLDGQSVPTVSGGGPQTFLTSRKHLSSAALLALHTTPVQLVAAPGANEILLPTWAWTAYTFVTTPYNSGGVFFAIDSVFGFANSNLLTLQNDNSGIGLDQASSQLAFLKSEKWATLAGSDIVGPLAGLAGQPLVALVAAAHPLTTGDGTLDITLTYSVLKLA